MSAPTEDSYLQWVIPGEQPDYAPVPDGSVFGGVFYPFMVDCPTCDGMGTISAADEHPQVPCNCELGQVRNPALEWQLQYQDRGFWRITVRPETDFKSSWTGPIRWVAVGVKEVSEIHPIHKRLDEAAATDWEVSE